MSKEVNCVCGSSDVAHKYIDVHLAVVWCIKCGRAVVREGLDEAIVVWNKFSAEE